MPSGRNQSHTKKSLFRLLRRNSLVSGSSSLLFGKNLESMEELTDNIPGPVAELLSVIENKCTSEGLFRLSASIKDVELAKELLDTGKQLDLSGPGQEILASSLVKLYLRELPQPILGHNAINLRGDIDEVKSYILTLPIINQHLLKALFRCLSKIAASKDTSKMDASNLAVVIGPNLLWYTGEKEKISPPAATQISYILIQNYFKIFDAIPLFPQEDIEVMKDHAQSIDVFEKEASEEPTGESSDDDIGIIVNAVYELQQELKSLRCDLHECLSRIEALENNSQIVNKQDNYLERGVDTHL